MPSKSKAQQKFMGAVYALKKGDIKPSDVTPAVRKVAKDMKKSDAKDFASTKHKGLPKKVKQEILNKLKEYANKMGRDHLGGDDYTSKRKGGLRDFDGYDNVDYNKDMPMDEASRGEIHKAAKKGSYPVSLVVSKNGKVISQVNNINTPQEVPAAFLVVKNYHKHKGATVAVEDRTGKIIFKESVNEGPIDRVIGGRPYQYVGDGRKGKVTVSGPLKDRERKDILKRAKKAGYSASPGIKGGVVIHVESIYEGMFSTIDQIRQDSKNVRDFVKKVFSDRDFKDMKNDKEFLKYLKSIYEGVDESVNEGKIPQPIQNLIDDMVKYKIQRRSVRIKSKSGLARFMKDVKPALKDKLLTIKHNPIDKDELFISLGPKAIKESKGVPQNYMQGRTSDYHTALRGKNRKYDDTNFDKENSGQGDLEESFDKLEHLKLLNQALKAIPGSQKQKEIIRQLNKVRKSQGKEELDALKFIKMMKLLSLTWLIQQ